MKFGKPVVIVDNQGLGEFEFRFQGIPHIAVAYLGEIRYHQNNIQSLENCHCSITKLRVPMVFLPPLPRYRLYSKPGFYATMSSGLMLGRVLNGNDTSLLECRLAADTDIGYALCVPQARVGIYLALKAAIARTGRDEIVVSPYTIFDVINMVLAAGGRPVFADIEIPTCNLKPEQVERRVGTRTAAVLTTHLHGLVSDVERLHQICKAQGALLIADAAQAFGARLNGKEASAYTDATVFSFGMMKNVNALYGGAVVTNDEELYRTMLDELAGFGPTSVKRLLKRMVFGVVLDFSTLPAIFKTFTYWLIRYGYIHNVEVLKSISRSENNPLRRDQLPEIYQTRLSPLQARAVLTQLDCVENDMQLRITKAQAYHQALSDIPEISLPPMWIDGTHAYTTFPILVENREALLRYLMKNGRDCAAQHLHNCAELACFEEFWYSCPNAKLAAERTMLLPTYPRYYNSEVKKTIATIRSFFGRN